MKKITVPLLLVMATATAFSQIKIKPDTREVVVYRTGAKLTAAATVSLPAGKSEVVFENLSPFFNEKSLQVRLGGGSTLAAASFRLVMPDPENPSGRLLQIIDSLEVLNEIRNSFTSESSILAQEANLLEINSQRVGTTSAPSGQTHLSVDELAKLSDFYRKRRMEMRDRNQEIDRQQVKIARRMAALEKEKLKLKPNVTKSTGEITLKINSKTAQRVEVVCIFLVSNASWSPVYDLRSEGLEQPLRVATQANVVNRTGFDWKNVKISLSSAQPLANNDRPVLAPLFVDFQMYAMQENAKYQQNQSEVDKAGINIYRSQAPRDQIYARPEVYDFLEDADGSGDSGGDDLLTVFELTDFHDIASDGEAVQIFVEEQNIPAIYTYHAVPKRENAVFLLAKVPDYGKYNLLPGKANIFLREMFVGQTEVNPSTTYDTLLLSLGRDDQISIKRVQPKDFTERKKLFDKSVKETFLYEISVRNGKKVPVVIEVLDQLPVSKQKEIEVNLEESDGGKFTAETGKMLWTLEVKPEQTRKIRFSYSLKYPKGRILCFPKN